MSVVKQAQSFDPIWEDLYGKGAIARCPYDFVASFVYRHAPRDKNRKDVRVLEVGCGSGNNLWFLGKEGFDVTGLDGSESAINAAKERLKADNITATLDVGDFTKLPYADNSFDMVIDRGALTCCGTDAMKKSIGEIHRVLKKEGFFLFNPIADSDTSFRAGEMGEDGLIINIKQGDYAGVGQIRFVSRRDIQELLPANEWAFERIERVEIQDMLNPMGKTIANWRVECKKA